jgi:hypothetical protein
LGIHQQCYHGVFLRKMAEKKTTGPSEV